MTDIITRAGEALKAITAYRDAAQRALAARVTVDGKVNAARLDAEQRGAHGFAWVASVVASLEATHQWATSVAAAGEWTELEALVLEIGFGEYCAHLVGGLPMSANEFFRPAQLGLGAEAAQLAGDPAVAALIAGADNPALRAQLVGLLRQGRTVAEDVGDDMLAAIRDQYRRFTTDRIIPNAQRWHLDDALIPDDLIAELAALGTFGVCIDPEYGGLGLGKLAMCVVTEELSRGWIGTGSLGTRSEIAGELITIAGTAAQKQRWLPGIASGEILPTAVFTEPSNGSDLAGLNTRTTQLADGSYQINGAKIWITHASRSDLMTVLTRTGGAGSGGLSMMLAPKPRGTEGNPFPAEGMEGGEIPVPGYRGMREYELNFTNFAVDAEGLLGGEPGQGFRQLMQTFEGARIQTAARAVGVARRAFELALGYASERLQFGKPIAEFPRVSDKIAMMLVECVFARELAYFAAREKDTGLRCDVEAGMAKLLGARVAWSNADNALQVHGGNGYALESEVSRVLADARILNVFEGAAEIQAHVIARGLLK